MNDLHKTNGYGAISDVAKVFRAVPRMMITDIIQEVGALEPIALTNGNIKPHPGVAVRCCSYTVETYPHTPNAA